MGTVAFFLDQSTTLSVSDGVVTHENSLFQRDQPHLVKQMRVDSDMMDIYDQHLKPVAVPESIEFLESTPTSSSKSAVAAAIADCRGACKPCFIPRTYIFTKWPA